MRISALSDCLSAKSCRYSAYYLYLAAKGTGGDIARNLTDPVAEMGLDIRIETRTGDTPQSKRARQRHTPPQFLLTTPESLEIMLSWPEAGHMFSSVKTIIIDEIHALAGTKRGDLLSLSLAALRALAPSHRPLPYLQHWLRLKICLAGWAVRKRCGN